MKKFLKLLVVFLVFGVVFRGLSKINGVRAQQTPKVDCNVFVWQERNGNTCYAPGCIEGPKIVSVEDFDLKEDQGDFVNIGSLAFQGSRKISIEDFSLKENKKVFVRIENLFVQSSKYSGKVDIDLVGSHDLTYYEAAQPGVSTTIPLNNHSRTGINVEDGFSSKFSFDLNAGKGTQTYDFSLETKKYNIDECNTTIRVSSSCSGANSCQKEPINVADNAEFIPFDLCKQVADPKQNAECVSCLSGERFGSFDPEKKNNVSGFWTAIGCIPTKPESIIKTFIKLGLSIGGGVTLLLILAGAFQLSISQGDAKKTDDAKQQITSAIIGLIFIILSVTILQFIGVSLFQIPGFGT